MKYTKILYLLTALILAMPANADTVAIHTLQTLAATAASVATGGTTSTGITSSSGDLTTPLSVTFTLNSNEAVNDVLLRALVNSENSTTYSSFASGNTTAGTTSNLYMVLGSSTYPPTAAAIANCKSASPTSVDNPDSIAYGGTVSINNGGSVQYVSDAGDTNGYFACNLNEGDTDITLSIGTAPKAGTYDAATALDCDDTFTAEIYLDNIP